MDSTLALDVIRRCVEQDRVIVLPHFTQRMEERGVFWGDVLLILAKSARIGADGLDDYGRERWLVSGQTTAGNIEFVCAVDEFDPFTLFVTLYWE